MLLGTLVTSILGNLLTGIRAKKIRAKKTGYNYMGNLDKKNVSSDLSFQQNWDY